MKNYVSLFSLYQHHGGNFRRDVDLACEAGVIPLDQILQQKIQTSKQRTKKVFSLG